jgi:DDE superfamily endonuclease
MEDVIQTYMLPYDPKWPVVCFDEVSKQLFGEVRAPEAARPGAPARRDYEYERKGVCCPLVMCEPLRGWRHVTVTERRTRQDYAHCIRPMVAQPSARATKIRLVQDHLNTHDGANLYETFPPAEARRILDQIEFHYTPKHGSGLNRAETEINIRNRQCLNRRRDSQGLMAEEVAAWEDERNTRKTRIHWTFTLAVARQKPRRLYPSI